MKIGGEEVELVTDFAQLRSGMIVWETDCDDCDDPHRYIVLRLSFGEYATDDDDEVEVGVKWEMLPDPHGDEENFVDQVSIDTLTFYRVVDPLLDTDTSERAKELVQP